MSQEIDPDEVVITEPPPDFFLHKTDLGYCEAGHSLGFEISIMQRNGMVRYDEAVKVTCRRTGDVLSTQVSMLGTDYHAEELDPRRRGDARKRFDLEAWKETKVKDTNTDGI